ncbi:MAG TPA: hypothetical protein VH142_14340, partial [Polyangiaceae bacterium]|nr:hypothetical protein [Polyangiaceae bacterium]
MPPLRRRVVSTALGAALAVVLQSPAARSATPGDDSLTISAIGVELGACPNVDRDELQKLLALEFQTLGVQPNGESERVVVACSAERARLTLEPDGASSDVELSGTTPSAWPRLLALAVSELVIETRARVRVATLPASPVAKRTAVASIPATPRAIPLRLFAGAEGRWLPHASSNLWGPELGVEMDRFFPLTLEVRLHASFGSTSTDVARVHWTAEGGAVTLRWDLRLGRVTVGAGPGFSVDALQLSPSVKIASASGQSLSGPWGGPDVDARGLLALGGALLVYARVDAGV